MKRSKLLAHASLLLSVTAISAICLAADPPAPEQRPANSFAAALQEAHKLSPDQAIQKAREMRALSDKGDAAATYEFGVLLALFGRFGMTPDVAHVQEWIDLSGYKTANQWIIKSGDLGDPRGIEFACLMAADYLASADLRSSGKAACDAGKSNQQPPASPGAG